ncbi:MAG TPA: hypothetical protein PKJ25_10755 [Smithellaceae bacterium]|jgi:hypothetical protein|nr:hypothetical protein [Smithellaceae bacterium]HOC61315.1 hypothetical protein [Smithellaceae bacterium]
MSHHLVERRKELKRRRKRRREIVKAKNRDASRSKAATIKQLKIAKETEIVQPLLNPAVTHAEPLRQTHEPYAEEPIIQAITSSRNLYKTDWRQVVSITELIKVLPEGVKSKKIWQDIHNQMKEEIIMRARQLLSERYFTPPAGWDGSLKQALLEMYRYGRIPRGFGVYLGLL